MLAQGPVEFPWNPDSDGDDFIGVNDLMALLGEFDSVFSEEGLYLSDDSLSAMYNVGDESFLECQIACQNLPGRWRMPKYEDVLISGQEMWLRHEGYPTVGPSSKAVLVTENGGLTDGVNMQSAQPCFCVTKERPKVEYAWCSTYLGVTNTPDATQGSGVSSFQSCCNSRVSDGWYPLGGLTRSSDSAGQAFWRWAE